MAKGSFRAVPSKVRRFVEFVGADLSTDRLDRHQWRSWVRHLKIEVEEGGLAVNAARVIYSRAQMFVRVDLRRQIEDHPLAGDVGREFGPSGSGVWTSTGQGGAGGEHLVEGLGAPQSRGDHLQHQVRGGGRALQVRQAGQVAHLV
jgi:hypothetical protein